MLTKAWSAAKLVIAMRANLLAWDVPLAAETLVTTFLRILSTSSIWKSSCCGSPAAISNCRASCS